MNYKQISHSQCAGVCDRPHQIARKITEILGQEFQNPNDPMNPTALSNLRISELIGLYNFLTSHLIQHRTGSQRPPYPQENSRTYSISSDQCRIEILRYIADFGYQLQSDPKKYPLSFLETLANYCEYHQKNRHI